MEISLTPSEEGNQNRNSELLAQVNACVERLEKTNTDITEGYENWLRIGFALTCGLGEMGREPFHRISRLNHSYTHEESEKFYTSLLTKRRTTGKRITIATFFYMLKIAGICINKDDDSSIMKVD